MYLAYYLDNFSPFIWEITPGFGPRWYGFAYVMAFVAGYFLYRWLAQRGYTQMPPELVGDFITWGGLFGVFLGGRLGSMIFYSWHEWIHDPLLFFKVWDGGMASHGGIIGLTIFTWYFARRHHLSWTSIGDNLCVVAPIGLFFGRLANFINGELYGRAAQGVSWAMQFPKELQDNQVLADRAATALVQDPGVLAYAAKHYSPVDAIIAAARTDGHVREVLRAILTPRYPSQLIEAALEGVVLFSALWVLRTMVKAPRGVITGAFFILYALLRIAGEQFREPGSDSPFKFIFGFLTYGQLLSIFLIFAGIAFLVWGFRTRQYERAFGGQ
ncbi:MAG TPA: prolipoprotein diacylglyceryl transferase [Chthoniobacteraceae bacterium]|jgi:phosphatidylglycerol:prolipoprotein diacylglycerol transferase|nr:prolipoprotein diacylglyceryl transferase [Chthoniobacteraceae bacterium]